jgi:hypothetical protein
VGVRRAGSLAGYIRISDPLHQPSIHISSYSDDRAALFAGTIRYKDHELMRWSRSVPCTYHCTRSSLPRVLSIGSERHQSGSAAWHSWFRQRQLPLVPQVQHCEP